ncbi:alpha/beta hydrolase [Caulobacter sp. KR2-114]|uniref:alpha/beta hydrolase n=1 Tax=Caulobacter sp. KR2-114 TaxID=3400912 RepID=UPI003C0C5B05
MQRTFVTLADGRRIHAACIGRGSPTVLFEQGGEASILNWQQVQPAITALTRTCFYDRAGFGYSDPPPGQITAVTVTDDTRAILAALHVEGPIVIVGHSIGGFYGTIYAQRFPGAVAGLVLVDPGFGGQVQPRDQAQKDTWLRNIRPAEAHLLECADLARQGRQHIGEEHGCIRYRPAKSPAEAAYLSYIVEHPYWYEAEYNQSRNYFIADQGLSEDTQESQRVARPLGDMPLVVLTSEFTPMGAWMDEALRRQFLGDWRAGHDRIAALSTRGVSRIVPGSTHFIQLSRPQAVVDAITRVVEDVRRERR